MKKIRVLLADDHMVVREGLRAMLACAEDVEIVGEASDGWEAVRLAKTTAPEVIVMDLAMPSLNGLGAMQNVLKQSPEAKVLVLSSYGEDDCVDQLIAAGASGYLVKQTAANELHKAIQEVHRGHNCFSPAVLKRLQERGHEALPGGRIHNGRGRGAKITDRECEVLCLVARGFSNKEAAAELGISIKTIEKHRQQVMNKLNIHEAAGLTRYALAQGLVDRHAPAQRVEEEVKQVCP